MDKQVKFIDKACCNQLWKKAKTTALKSSHVPMISKPDKVAKIIIEAAREL